MSGAGFTKSVTGGNPMKPEEGKIMSWKNDQFRLASIVLMTATVIIGAVAMEGMVS
ncbi:MAG: hypothetical protein GY729_04135 [Desulfobacteraceae bacterium]|nr:hypothetical protein [Desulfobacteraceae bacterium]